MKISNTTDFQIPLVIVGAHGDEENILMQPRGSVDLPEGFTVKQQVVRGIFVTPDPEPAAAPAVAVETKAGRAKDSTTQPKEVTQ